MCVTHFYNVIVDTTILSMLMEKINALWEGVMETLGSRVKSVRLSAEMTQYDFSRKIGVSRSHVSKIETDALRPSNTVIKVICLVFKVDEDWLKDNSR